MNGEQRFYMAIGLTVLIVISAILSLPVSLVVWVVLSEFMSVSVPLILAVSFLLTLGGLFFYIFVAGLRA